MKTILLISPILFALLHAVFCDSYTVYYVDKACPSPGTKVQFPLGTSGKKTAAILRTTKNVKISAQDCWISFGTSSRASNILFSIRKIDFKKPDCSRYYIDAFTGQKAKFIKKFCNYQKDYQESYSYITNDPLLLFHFVTADKIFADVEIVVTAYSNVSSAGFNYKCNNNKYISSSLTCDDHNNCGDRSDEMNCKLTPGIISAIVIGCLLLIAAISGAIWCFSRRTVRTTRYIYS